MPVLWLAGIDSPRLRDWPPLRTGGGYTPDRSWDDLGEVPQPRAMLDVHDHDEMDCVLALMRVYSFTAEFAVDVVRTVRAQLGYREDQP